MKLRRFAVGLFFIAFFLPHRTNAAEKFVPAISPELRPSVKVFESFRSVVKIKVALGSATIEELSGWFLAPDVVITAAHKNQWDQYLVRGTAFTVEDAEGASWPATVMVGKPIKDFAALRIERNGGKYPSMPVAKIRSESPRKKELLWWQCGAGLLEKKWSVGFFLKDIRHPSGGTGYLIVALAGGNYTGCSGSPMFDNEGFVLGRISASVPEYSMRTGVSGLESGDGNLLNVIAAGTTGILDELPELSLLSYRALSDFPTLPSWMTPTHAVRKIFFGVVEVDLIDGATRIHASAWLVRPNILVTAGHFYNKRDLSAAAVIEFKDRSGKLWRAVPLPIENNDIVFFALDGKPDMPVVSLREEALDENGNELLWWYCASGLLQDEWSMGRFLGQVPPAGALEGRYANSVYLINTIAGGIHAGCSGAPVVDYQGRAIGFADGFMSGGSLSNIFAIRAEDIRRALGLAEGQKGKER